MGSYQRNGVEMPPRCARFCLLTCLMVLLQASPTQTLCGQLDISNTFYQTTREGKYSLMSSGYDCFGKRIWKQEGLHAACFIYYHKPVRGWEGWIVSTAPCGNVGSIAAETSSQHTDSPDQYQGFWEETVGNTWQINYNLSVKCTDGLSVGAIVAIVLAVAVVVIVIVSIVAYKCKVKKTTHQANVDRPSPQQVYGEAPDQGSSNISFISDLRIHQDISPPTYSVAMTSGHFRPPSYEEATTPYRSAPATNGVVHATDVTDQSVRNGWRSQGVVYATNGVVQSGNHTDETGHAGSHASRVVHTESHENGVENAVRDGRPIHEIIQDDECTNEVVHDDCPSYQDEYCDEVVHDDCPSYQDEYCDEVVHDDCPSYHDEHSDEVVRDGSPICVHDAERNEIVHDDRLSYEAVHDGVYSDGGVYGGLCNTSVSASSHPVIPLHAEMYTNRAVHVPADTTWDESERSVIDITLTELNESNI